MPETWRLQEKVRTIGPDGFLTNEHFSLEIRLVLKENGRGFEVDLSSTEKRSIIEWRIVKDPDIIVVTCEDLGTPGFVAIHEFTFHAINNNPNDQLWEDVSIRAALSMFVI